MPFRSIEQGIAAIQAGNRSEGARILRIALKDEKVVGSIRAIAYLWLAETNPDPQHKRACYTEALRADPNNPDAQQRLAMLLAADLPSPPPSTTPQAPPITPPNPTIPAAVTVQPSDTGPLNSVLQPVDTSAPYRIVGVIGGPNGAGTAFFVNRNGLLATSRHVVGGLQTVTVELETGRQLTGKVVRGFPEMDLAFVQVEQLTSDLLPVTPFPQLPNEAPLTAITHSGRLIKGKQRPTIRSMSPYWFSTDIVQLADAGGNPVFDDRHYLVGMLTKNSSRSSQHVFGVHVAAIRRCVDIYMQEIHGDSRRTYCPCCGGISKAVGVGGFYCEHCGGITPQALNITRVNSPQATALYAENHRMRCTNCQANVGFSRDGLCLRCGQKPRSQI